jgi:hypothetical protein
MVNAFGTKETSMATAKKPSKNMIRGSRFGTAEVSTAYLANNVVGKDLVAEFKAAYVGIKHLVFDGDDLNKLIVGEAPDSGMEVSDVPKHERFCKAVKDIKDKAREKGLPLQLGYTESDLFPAWYIDVDSPEAEVFEIKLTPHGRDLLRIIGGTGGIGFSTDVHECH